MEFFFFPSTITIQIPAVDRVLDYLKSKDTSAKQIADLVAQLNQSSQAVQDKLDAQKP